ncbi:MAG TPA: hypothetical protein VF988_02515, partial [Verrucomicrobiae bacterium]
LSKTARIAALWGLAGALLGLLALVCLQWFRLTESRLARLFEKHDATLGSRLINAVQLADKAATGGAEEYFCRETIALGQQSAQNLPAWPVVRRDIKIAAALFFGAIMTWILLLVLNFDLAKVVAPRFLHPYGDHPPYSRLHITVTADHAQVLYGGQIEVRALAQGRPVEKLWLVAKTGTNETRTIMFLAPDKSFFQSLVNLRERTEYYVTDGAARSRRYSVDIRFTPQITLVEVTENFPAYTSKPAHTGKLPEEAQSLPEGTRVTFRVASNRPLKSGALVLTPVLGGRTNLVSLLPEPSSTVVTGAFTLTQPVVFNLTVRDVDNLDSANAKRGRFNILPDRSPRIFVLEPGRDAVATPDIRVPVRVRAEDDYAVARIAWLRSHNRSVEHPVDLKLVLKNGPQNVEAAGAFALDELGVHPGDVIEYYFEAADNYPAGPNVAFSRPFRLQIISREQFETILRQNAARKALFEPYFKLDAWMRRLAERGRNLAAAAKRGDTSAQTEAEELAKQLAQYDEALGKLLNDPAMFDVDNSFRATLGDDRMQLRKAGETLQRSLGAGGAPDPNAMRQVSDVLDKVAGAQDEQVEQPAQQIASVVRVVTKADAFVKLAQEQATLAQLL